MQEEAARHQERLTREFGGSGGGSGSGGGGSRGRFSTSDWSWEDEDASNDSVTNQAAFGETGGGGGGGVNNGISNGIGNNSNNIGRTPPGPAFVKLMLPSHVSGGYWLQAPYGIGDFLPEDTTTVVLQCDGEEWKTVWLVRSANNGGLSGGWRGFAVDQRLAVGDACVFTKAGTDPLGHSHTSRFILTHLNTRYVALTRLLCLSHRMFIKGLLHLLNTLMQVAFFTNLRAVLPQSHLDYKRNKHESGGA